MPNIRTFETGAGGIVRTVDDRAGETIGRAVEGLGQELGGAVKQVSRHISQKQKDKINADAEEARTQLFEREDDFWAQADANVASEGGQSNSDRFFEEEVRPFTDALRGISSQFPDVKRRAEQQADDLENTFKRRAIGKERSLIETASVEDHKRQMLSMSTNVFNEPQDWLSSISRAEQAVNDRVAAGLLTSSQAEKLKTVDANSLALASANGLIDKDAPLALQELEDETYDKHLDADQKRILLNRARGKVAGEVNAGRALAFDDLNEQWRRQEATGSPVSSYTRADMSVLANEDPVKTARLEKRWDRSAAIGREFQATKGAPLDQRAARLQDMSASLGDSKQFDIDAAQLDIAASVYRKEAQKYVADPAGWAREESEVAEEAWEVFQDGPSTETFGAYVVATTAEQDRLAPGGQAKILPKEMIQQTALVMSSLKSEKGAADALDHINNLMQTAGKHTPQVISELRAKKALTGPQYGAALAAQNGNFVLAEEILKVSGENPEDLAKRSGLKGEQREIREDIVKHLKTFRTSIDQTDDREQTLRDIEDTAMLVLLGRSRLAGSSASSDTKEVVQQIVTGNYAFLKSGERVPNDVDIRGVKRGLRALRKTGAVEGRDIISTRSIGGLTDEEASDEFIRTVNDSAILRTSGDEKGLFVFDSLDTGRQLYERNADGQVVPVFLSWEDVIELGSATETGAAAIKLGKGIN